ncbi:hypothetical protein ACI8AF_25880 [Blastococcus sp. SYSU D00669]
MRTVERELVLIDAQLAVSTHPLAGARRRFAAEPSTANARLVERAREELDLLLDQRLLTRR